MFALSIAFVVFIWSALSLQIQSQSYAHLKSNGANIVVRDYYYDLNMLEYESLFKTTLKPLINSYTFVVSDATYPLAIRCKPIH